MIFKDPDCEQLAPSTKVTIRTYTTDKINIVGSCSLFAGHPDTSSLKQVTFYVTSHEGSAVLSCETSLKLSLIHPLSNLDLIPNCSSLVCSNADHSMKKKSKKSMQEKYVNQCVKDKVPVQNETSKWECQANIEEGDKNCQSINMQPVKPAVCDDNNCQSTKKQNYEEGQNRPVCSDKNCQDTQNINMWPVKPLMDIWSKEPAVQSSFKKKHVPLCSDKNCQSTRCYKKSEYTKCDKNCQYIQYICPKKPISNMQSVTKSSIPARKQPNHKICNSVCKNCQSTKQHCHDYKKCEYTKCLCIDKNCQSANNMCYDKKH